MKNSARQCIWVACLAALVLLAAPAASAGDVLQYSTPDSVFNPSLTELFLPSPAIIGEPTYSLGVGGAGTIALPVITYPVLIPVSPVLASPNSIFDNTADVPGAYYAGSASTGSSYTGSSWDWFRRSWTGGLCGL